MSRLEGDDLLIEFQVSNNPLNLMMKKMKMVKMSPEEKVKFANHEIDEYQKLSGVAAEQGNETLRFLSGQLILIAATIITISAAFIASGHDGTSLDLEAKQLLTTAWIALGLSIVLGIADILVTAKFFTRWQVYHYRMAEELSAADYRAPVESVIKDVRRRLKSIKPGAESSHAPLYAQLVCLGVGMMAFIVLIIELLF